LRKILKRTYSYIKNQYEDFIFNTVIKIPYYCSDWLEKQANSDARAGTIGGDGRVAFSDTISIMHCILSNHRDEHPASRFLPLQKQIIISSKKSPHGKTILTGIFINKSVTPSQCKAL